MLNREFCYNPTITKHWHKVSPRQAVVTRHSKPLQPLMQACLTVYSSVPWRRWLGNQKQQTDWKILS